MLRGMTTLALRPSPSNKVLERIQPTLSFLSLVPTSDLQISRRMLRSAQEYFGLNNLASRGGGQDTVVDNSGTANVMLFGTTINPLDLALSRQANDLRLAIHGSTDQVTIQNWYSGTTNQTETRCAGRPGCKLAVNADEVL